MQKFNEDLEFIENITREMMKAKMAIDEEVYHEIQRGQHFSSKELLSIVPNQDNFRWYT
jgi:hypothetical protein